MKGVSTVIATILMLMITIGLAGLAASYFFNLAGSQTDVVLGVDSVECDGDEVMLWIRNDGQDSSGPFRVYMDGVVDNGTFTLDDTVDLTANLTTSPNNIGAGQVSQYVVDMDFTIPVGTKNIRITNPRSTARGTVFCPGV